MADFVLNDSDTEIDSDEELQEAFAKGLLKPGLNEEVERVEKSYVNNVADLKAKLKEFELKLPWIETLDLVTTVAPMAPDVAMQIEETTQRRKNIKENTRGSQIYDPAQDPVLNEFKRENLIHRQAQAAVLDGIKRLKDLNVPTRRPDDYFAEMAKSDEHMQKVRKNLMTKQAAQARVEKVRQLREQKKIAKRVQVESEITSTDSQGNTPTRASCSLQSSSQAPRQSLSNFRQSIQNARYDPIDTAHQELRRINKRVESENEFDVFGQNVRVATDMSIWPYLNIQGERGMLWHYLTDLYVANIMLVCASLLIWTKKSCFWVVGLY